MFITGKLTDLNVHNNPMEHYSAVKKNKILINATGWIKLTTIMLNKRNRTQNDCIYIKCSGKDNGKGFVER